MQPGARYAARSFLAPHHGANPKPSIEEQAGDSASDRPQLARGAGHQYRSVIYIHLLPRARQLPGSVVSPAVGPVRQIGRGPKGFRAKARNG